ncbi:MAG: hypothetical protein AB7U83_16355 [Vicinamibacterales bacterium]
MGDALPRSTPDPESARGRRDAGTIASVVMAGRGRRIDAQPPQQCAELYLGREARAILSATTVDYRISMASHT